MYTQCPHCLTVYEPSAEQLASGRGQLRCGVCERVFDALEYLGDEPVRLRAKAVPHGAAAPRIVPAQIPEQGELFQPVSPGFARRTRVPAVPASGRWWLAACVLGLLLGAQIVLAQRDELARDPGWRAFLLRACATLGCSLQPWRTPERIQVTARDVRPHPSVPDALLISVSFRNTAPFAQAWPILELTLRDLDGNPVAMRRFRVQEYLGAPPRSESLAAGQSVDATLELADPGKRVIAYAFDFR
ncbi:MAG TPA: zinc-ribbon and DUF3426 domain-containing protein [Xanthomonadaceae bacterium]|nr:zinc-ribbon and DUF3426 domain-containing protein [Xanthomonadaceae bacterium]